MPDHTIVSREEWAAARDELLVQEKEHTRRGDELARQRLDGDEVYHAYSTTARGLEFLMGYYPILDRAPRGRDESDESQFWIRRHDEYAN